MGLIIQLDIANYMIFNVILQVSIIKVHSMSRQQVTSGCVKAPGSPDNNRLGCCFDPGITGLWYILDEPEGGHVP